MLLAIVFITFITFVLAQARVDFNFAHASFGVIGYMTLRGSHNAGQIADGCFGLNEGERTSGARCVEHASQFMFGNVFFGIAFGSPNVKTMLLQFGSAVANYAGAPSRLGSVDPQGEIDFIMANFDAAPEEERMGLTREQALTMAYNVVGLGNDENDTMIGTEVGTVLDKRQACFMNGRFFNERNRYEFSGSSGLKLVCEEQCGRTALTGDDINAMSDNILANMFREQSPNAQFTVFNRNSGLVTMRCRMIIQTQPADVCFEFIDGNGAGCFV